MIALIASGIHARPPQAAGVSGYASWLVIGVVLLVIGGGLAISETRRVFRRPRGGRR